MADGDQRRDEVTTGELNRSIAQLRLDHGNALEQLERSVRERVDLIRDDLKEDMSRIESSLSSLSFVTRESFDVAQVETHRRLETIENWQTWAIRLLLSIVVTSLVGLVLALAGVAP